jgi:hypothetical protein
MVLLDRLQDVVHSEKRLYLVFEYLDLDLKKHMDSSPDFGKDLRQVKVSDCCLLEVCAIRAMRFIYFLLVLVRCFLLYTSYVRRSALRFFFKKKFDYLY